MRFHLRNLIGNNAGHEIFIVENGFYDIDEKPVPENEIHNILENVNTIFIHFLDEEKARLINKYGLEKKIVWFCWGADAYYLGKFDNKFLLPKTKKIRLLLGLKSFKGFKDIIKFLLKSSVDKIAPNKIVLEAITKIDLIVPIVDQDYENLKKYYDFDIDKYQLNYINNVFYHQPKVKNIKNRNNILVGNSASLTNNHVEFIDQISTQNLGTKKIFFPLSYGNNDYANYVKKYALKKISDNAVFLDKYLPFEEYLNLQNTCQSLVMNHCRQQALGNIILGIWFGSNIFLRSNSGLYKHFTEKGFKIFKTEEFDLNTQLSEDEIEVNRSLLHKWHGPQYLNSRFNNLLKRIDEI
mgnify:FL=1|tara:strand:+ start:51419 stop:52477 length:1059 start_codon:yes stop_codon:yes gene_type:complete